jgi:hypothetical protein
MRQCRNLYLSMNLLLLGLVAALVVSSMGCQQPVKPTDVAQTETPHGNPAQSTPSDTQKEQPPAVSDLPAASGSIAGRVEGGGGAIAKAQVTLWAAGPDAPKKLAETETKDDGSFELKIGEGKDDASVLYLIAQGPSPEITLMATLGTDPPERVTINELTTVASAWTGAQFLKGSELSGNALGLRIAAGNVRNLVDLETGGLGSVIVDPLNGPQTTTLARFNTLGILLSACVAGAERPSTAKVTFGPTTTGWLALRPRFSTSSEAA